MKRDALELFQSAIIPPPGADARGGAHFALPTLTGSANAFLALAVTDTLTVCVTPGIPDADTLFDDLTLLAGNKALGRGYGVRVLHFPALIPNDPSSLGVRLKTLAALRAWSISPYSCVIVVPYPALQTPIPASPIAPISLGSAAFSFAELVAKLTKIGYRRVPVVAQEGDYSVRGGILDVWSPGEEYPIRAEFFGDELESLRNFNPATQLSIERIKSCEILPMGSGGGDVSDAMTNIFALLPPSAKVIAFDHNSYSLAAFERELSTRQLFYVGDPAPPRVSTLTLATCPLPGFSELGAGEAHHPELFDAARQRLEQHVAAAKLGGTLVLPLDELSAGFECGKLLVVTKSDRVFAKRKLPRSRPAPVSGARLADFDDLEPGEYVVHVDHGVGKYIGSSEIIVDGKRSEVFTVEYADGGKLHVPAAHAHLLSRYVGVKGEAVRVHKLDGKRWNKDKHDAERAVADLAAALLETQASRAVSPGFQYDVDCEGLEAFEAAFPFAETDDQLSAIAAIKQDLGRSKPMDRLLCGDAGYGKTEVAMRAAYIAAMNGRQTAVLAPTTILAEQHFETFTSRFDGTPVRIESVSRFQSKDVHNGTFSRLENGACDIVIGTHAILSSKIRFKDLGLIIIDEEQRFGVRHKEFLKRLRATADVLTLSATPIPRTLYLSMTGARDLSLIRTPPRERVAVETNIIRDSDAAIAQAIDSEIARGGQVFFLHNRVATIHQIEKRLKVLCPAARVVVAHGQMDSRTLAVKMREFERGNFDVLLSTTIIESGIDIPRANTIIVDRADCFGLADLYQLRGRVGRSSKQGRAYFLLPREGVIESDARERLDALKRHGSLGAGFGLAVRDLEMRGAGNLLGAKQSGHIAAVGFGLYCRLLKRTIAILKGETPEEEVDVRFNLDFLDYSPSGDYAASAAIPYAYIEDDALRMGFMKRFAEAGTTAEVRVLEREITDRFGKPPPSVVRMLNLARLRIACAAAHFGNLDVKDGRAVCYRAGTRVIALVITLRGKTPDAKIAELLKAIRGFLPSATNTSHISPLR